MTYTRWQLFRDRLKRFRQHISRSRFALTLGAAVIAFYIWLVYMTSRKEIMGDADALALIEEGAQSTIFAFWHGRLMMMPVFKPKNRALHVMISHHNDGELIARTMQHFGVGAVRGSSSSGGARALATAIRHLKNQDHIGITPDGPRGPNRVAQMGVIQLAKHTGVPILPISVASSRHKKLLNSWDRMQVALPFSHLVICFGALVRVPPDADAAALEAYRLAVEDAVNEATRRADYKTGVTLHEEPA